MSLVQKPNPLQSSTHCINLSHLQLVSQINTHIRQTLLISFLTAKPNLYRTATVSAPTASSDHCFIIVSLSFSSTSRYLVAICDDPSRTLLYWSWKRSKLLLSTKVTVSVAPEILHCVSFNPQTHLNVYVFGNKFLKLFRFEGSKNKQFNFPKIVPQDFKCYCWDAKQRLLVGTGSGRVLFIEDTDLRLDFNVFQYSNISDESIKSCGVTAVTSYSKGFITACGKKCVQFFERDEVWHTYKSVRNVWLPLDVLENSDLCNQIIKWMVVDPSEEVLVISTNMKQMYSTQINPSETKQSESNVFDVLVQPFHYKHITGCCVSLWKPFIATSSLDGSIKLWNHETFSLEFSKNFSEEVYSISMHPMGLFLLAGFFDRLSFMYILRDDFKPFKDINIRRCTHCNFSRGGHMFAAVNNNFIQVYSSITFEMLANLKGHNGKVQATSWCMDDNNLISCGLDGAIYEWDIKTEKRIGECVLKSCACNDVAVNTDNKKLYVVSSDHSLNEIHKSNILRTFPPSEFLYTSVALSWSNTMLFVGTNDGYIRSMACPPIRGENWRNYPCHSLETTHMIFTTDDRYLISTSRDFSIAIWKVDDTENQSTEFGHSTIWSEDILMPVNELEEKMCSISKLKSRVEELSKKNEYKLHLRDKYFNDKVKEVSENYNQVIENLKNKNKILEGEKVREKSSYDEKMTETINDHCTKIKSLECTTNKKLMIECEKIKYLEEKLIQLENEHEQEIEKLDLMQESLETQLADKYEKKTEYLEKKIYECDEKLLTLRKECEKSEKLSEEDAEMESLSTKVKYEKLLYVERSTYSKRKFERNVLRKKLFAFPNQLKENEDECWKLKMELERLKIVKNNLEENIEILREEVKLQCQGLTKEDKRFCELKLMNQSVTKLKCKLEWEKIIELRQLVDERETEINKTKKQMAGMRNQLENFTTQFFVMDYNTAEMKMKLGATFKELDDVRRKLKQKTDLWDRFCSDLNNLMSFKIQDPHQLKNCIKTLYEKYVVKNVDKIASSDPNLQIEWGRQRNHFEYAILKLKYTLNSTTKRINQKNQHLNSKRNNLAAELQLRRQENSRRLLSKMEREK
ncbi:cilia- and flagella-associated protein 57 [Octopus bimaculoides]|uniref:cilia- and flagella-associated protein 57 n=1 Tax=Octopus bimaculoides TaxID=37653 RepID=UPI00071DF265|nr:cilia- and flagella-associated protein 57 [Octopus bimaculoides]|eukprot:XP_014783108.1 PREDICTED: cilia- and flagella-associated protein 57-like [Octopus bimaculoides]